MRFECSNDSMRAKWVSVMSSYSISIFLLVNHLVHLVTGCNILLYCFRFVKIKKIHSLKRKGRRRRIIMFPSARNIVILHFRQNGMIFTFSFNGFLWSDNIETMLLSHHQKTEDVNTSFHCWTFFFCFDFNGKFPLGTINLCRKNAKIKPGK